jgi:hypothetical protein
MGGLLAQDRMERKLAVQSVYRLVVQMVDLKALLELQWDERWEN